jgi:hypothetical protein
VVVVREEPRPVPTPVISVDQDQRKRWLDQKAQEELERAEHDQRQAIILADRKAKYEAQQAREAQLRVWAGDARYAVPVLSAMICEAEQGVEDGRADLEHEKKIGRMSGAVSLSALRAAAEVIDENENDIKNLKKVLRDKWSAARVPCGKLAGLRACHRAAPPSASSAPDAAQCAPADRDTADVWLGYASTVSNPSQ